MAVWKLVQCVCVCRHSSAQKNLVHNVHLMTLPKRSLRALNFIPSKSNFRYSKALLHVYIFEIQSWYELDFPKLHNANIFYHQNNLKVSVLFVYNVHQFCQSNQLPPVECDNIDWSEQLKSLAGDQRFPFLTPFAGLSLGNL